VEAKKALKTICEESRNAYYRRIENQINEVQSSSDWWKLVKQLKNQTDLVESEIPANELKDYFKNLLNNLPTAQDIHFAANLVNIHELDKPISEKEIISMLQKTKKDKAPGLDRIPYEFFKYADKSFIKELAKTYTIIYNNCQFDDAFETSVICPIFKKGDRSDVANYRGISFMNCIAKILMGVLTTRLEAWLESNNILTEYQAGFRKNFSTADNIFNLANIVHLKFKEKRKVYAMFVDFKAAFDKVPRKLLFYKLRNIGLSTKFVNFVEMVYSSTKSVVWNGTSMSSDFETHIGVKQGCLMSPLLFSLYLNDIHEYLGGGLNIDDMNIRVLLYADDIVIISENIDVLQSMIDKLQSYCETWGLEVNLLKSAIMVFRNGGKLSNKEKWTFQGQEVEIRSEYTYLGVILTPKMIFTKHTENRIEKAKICINSTWSNYFKKENISLKAKWKMFQAVCRSIQTYAAQVWGFDHFDVVDKIQHYFLKRILKLPNCTPSYALHLETGIEDAHIHTLDLHLRYAQKVLYNYNVNRLTHKLAKKTLQNNIFWAQKINHIGQDHNVSFHESLTKNEWQANCNRLLLLIKNRNDHNRWQTAINSSRIYHALDHNIGVQYFKNTFSRYKIMWIFKARVDLIYLNGFYARNCTICNLNEEENIQHFLGRCPILKRIRKTHLGKELLTEQNVIDTLNGINDPEWDNLVNYIKDALKYRNLILNEFDL